MSFLQGLVSNDVAVVAPGRPVWAALLTPQGKWLADFFVFADGDRLLLDCEAGQAPAIAQRLLRYRLRSRVAVEAVPLAVYAGWAKGGAGGDPLPDPLPEGEGVIGADPRCLEAGWRVISASPLAGNASFAAWDRHRLALGLPDGSRDLEAEKSTLLEAGFDELHGVSWTKGCYMGQELTARTKYRGLLKRRLVPVRIEGACPPPGTPITRDGAEIGTMRSGIDGLGMALLRIEAIGSDGLACGGSVLHPAPPHWMALQPLQIA